MFHATADEIRAWSPNVESQYREYVSFENRTVLINNLAKKIGVGTRDGVKFDLPPSNNLCKPALIVRTTISVSEMVYQSIVEQLIKSGVDNDEQLRLISNQWRLDDPSSYKNFNGLHKVHLEYHVCAQSLKKYGGTLYVREIDMVVSIHGASRIGYHPYSREGLLRKHLAESEGEEKCKTPKSKFNIELECIDNLGQIGTKYIQIGDKTHVLPTNLDPERPDGIYAVFTKPVESALEKPVTVCDYFEDLEKFDLFKLYDSYDVARVAALAGDDKAAQIKINEMNTRLIESQNRLELATGAAERVKAEFDLFQQKTQHDLDRAAHDRRVLEMEIEKTREERIRDKERDVHDAVSTNRKNTTELLKAIPALLLAILGIVSIFAKSSKA
jgi:hypothetical protein